MRRNIASALAVKKKYSIAERRQLGLNYKLMKNINKPHKKRKDALTEEQISVVNSFYIRGDITRDIPDAGSAKKNKDEVI